VTLSNGNNWRVSSYFDSWKANLRIYGRMAGLLRPHWLMSLCTVICVALATVFSLVVPWLIGLVIDIAVPKKDLMDLLLAAAAILVASALRGLFAYGQGYYSQTLSQLVAYDLRDTLYAHLQRLSFSFHDDSETGQLMSRMTADIEAVRQFYPLGLMRGIVAVATFGAVTVLLFMQDWQLGLIMLICVPILLVLSVQVAKRLAPLWFDIQNGVGALSTIMQEGLSGIRVVKSFARENFEIQKFEQENHAVRGFNMDAMRLSAWNQPLMVLALNVVTVLIVWVGGVAVIQHRLTLGTLVAVTSYVIVLASPVRSFGFMINWFMRGLSGGERIFELLDTEPVIKDAPNAHVLEKVKGSVRYEHVSFAYGNGVKVLDDINIEARPGQAIALLGPTGSGKSTILHLLPRFYDVTAGRITLDGKDVREVTQSSLRRNIGLVLQDVFLFNATIRDNIAYGTVNATEEQIIEAARVARIHDFICTLPDGYDTWVGERGVTLSGGQKQRVAIARTLLLNPAILVLDDSTSSVDMETEYLIQQALEAVMRGRTTFVVASRLRTIKHADQILVLEHGRIVERGTHESLVKLKGPYARLYDLQLREQEEFEAQMLASGDPQEFQPDDQTRRVAR
jgi:ABC-type multidrug transport system fused ATPase/permease subunit